MYHLKSISRAHSTSMMYVKLLIESMFDGVIRSEGTIIQNRGHGSDLPIDGLKRLLLTCIACKHYQGTDIETVESTRGDVKGAN